MCTGFVEFRQLQEIGIFFYLCYSLAKSHINGWECFEAWISRVFGLKTFEPSGENPNCCGREQCQHKGFTVHVNSDMIFGVNFYDVELFKMNCLFLLISQCELILVLSIVNLNNMTYVD